MKLDFPLQSLFPFLAAIGCMLLMYLGHFPEVTSPAGREAVAPVDGGAVPTSVVPQDHRLPLVTCSTWRGQLSAKQTGLVVTQETWTICELKEAPKLCAWCLERERLLELFVGSEINS